MPPARATAPTAPIPYPPCVWMSAGLLSFKLCDRDFDCEHCPLDAALCGRRRLGEAAGIGVGGPVWFPADRRYTPGHLWIAEHPDSRLRLGVNAFAAALLGRVRSVKTLTGERVAAGEPLCEMELAAGRFTVSAPAAGRRVASNPRLGRAPDLLRREPYAGGWLAEMTAAEPGAAEPGAAEPGAAGRHGGADLLLDTAGARRQADFDLRRFRRRVALALLADDHGIGPTLPDGGELALDVPGLLGPRRHLELLREMVH